MKRKNARKRRWREYQGRGSKLFGLFVCAAAPTAICFARSVAGINRLTSASWESSIIAGAFLYILLIGSIVTIGSWFFQKARRQSFGNLMWAFVCCFISLFFALSLAAFRGYENPAPQPVVEKIKDPPNADKSSLPGSVDAPEGGAIATLRETTPKVDTKVDSLWKFIEKTVRGDSGARSSWLVPLGLALFGFFILILLVTSMLNRFLDE